MIPAFVNANDDFIREILNTPDIASTSLKTRVKNIIAKVIEEDLDSDQIRFASTQCGFDENEVIPLKQAITTQLKKESKI